jgi:uncharacterized protein (DUF608 family)
MNRRTFLKNVSAGAATLATPPTLSASSSVAPTSPDWPPPAGGRSDRILYRGEHLRAVAMPLGGIGTGSVALAGDGGLRQWQIGHTVDHLAHVPDSFFAIWGVREDQPSVARVLQSSALYDQSGFKPPATANDHVVPPESRKLLERLPGVKGLEYAGEYPIAQIRYLDSDLPVEVSLEAYSPFIPLNAKDSGIPAVVFEFKVRNPGTRPVWASIMMTLQNLVGWDGHSPISGVESFAYGSNRNTLVRGVGLTSVQMSNPRLPDDFPFNGQLVLAAMAERVNYVTQWDDPELLWRDFSDDGELSNDRGEEASRPGRTWNGALAVPLELGAGEEESAIFVMAWHFPNRYVTWGQPALPIDDKKSKFWLGTMYSNWFASAAEVARYVSDNYTRLAEETRRWRDTFYDSTLPYELLDCVSSQASIIRTPTCIWVEDGHLHGFEGCCGASTTHCGNVGCCPLNCTHVWNYEQSLSRLFPDLERTMRHTDLEIQQHPSGYIPHRTIVPFYLPRNWDREIGGPANPALDGMLGTVLKTYREYRQGGGREWLLHLWPRVKRLMDYTVNAKDADGDGVIEGEQPNTYDISIYGPNSFIGSLYLAALRAAEEMARIAGEESAARRYREIYAKGRTNLPAQTWNGEYYVQKVDLEKHTEQQYGTGCHADQLLGQWWAAQLELGYVLPEDQVRTTLRSVARNNWREDFVGIKQTPRIFASEHDKGLLMCTWPKGGKPRVPTLYSDEVWTGIEYEVAALLLYEGMVEEGLKIVRGARARYDGRERNPWNEIECGDHYARAMSSWALLEAAAGQRYNAAEGFLAFAPKTKPKNFRCFFITASGWGTFDQKASAAGQVETLIGRYGEIRLRTLEFTLGGPKPPREATVTLDGKPLPMRSSFSGKTARLESSTELAIRAGKMLRVEIVAA